MMTAAGCDVGPVDSTLSKGSKWPFKLLMVKGYLGLPETCMDVEVECLSKRMKLMLRHYLAQLPRFVPSIAPLAALAGGLVCAGTAQALPELQLTIPGGSYNATTETTVAAGQTFDLYALFGPKKDDLSDTFYVSFALELGDGDSPVGSGALNAGSFKFNGTTYNVTSGLTWGTPGALPTHGDFGTWYGVLPFQFSSSNQTTSFDAMDGAPASISGGCSTDCLYFANFTVDTSLLSSAYSIHFDLFDASTYDGDKNIFAPFSHDAQSSDGGCTQVPCTPRQDVPEPATLALMAAGLAGLVATRRRRR